MTEAKEIETGKLSRGQTLFCIMSVLAMLMTFIYSELAIEAMSAGMKLCVATVIPSLFPFMVLSELLVSSGAAELLGKYLARPLTRLFDISDRGAAALVLGLVCGFPIGSKSALTLYESGQITKGELEHLLSFCNSPSSAFLISAVGVGLFGSERFGVLLYAVHIISALSVGLLGRAFFAREKKKREYFSDAHRGSNGPKGFISSFTGAVSGSAGSMLMICAFVVFFSAVLGFLEHFARWAGLPPWLSALMLGLFEMTGGVSAAAGLDLVSAPVIAAMITGWSGLSVAFQLVSICREHSVPLRAYFLSKGFCSLMNGALIFFALRLLGEGMALDSGGSISSLLPVATGPVGAVWLAIFIGGCAMLIPKKKA